MSQPTEIPKPWSKLKETKKSGVPRRWSKNVKSAAPEKYGRRPLTREAAGGTTARRNDSQANDDREEDEPYRPGGDEVSSEKDVAVERSAGKNKTNVKFKTRIDKKPTKQKRTFGSMGAYHAIQDEGYEESDDGDSWHSEEMKTPPNSEDELEEVDSDEVFPVFRDGGRFGELRLAVGMTFTTKMEFKEAVREYCIQEGRRIWFKNNDNVRMRAVCKDENYGWLVYAANITENNYWQIKMFMDDHTCARNTKNRLANRKWLAKKLVKKLRKYPNLRHCEAAQYFKTKCDLDLSKCSLTRALGDARAVVYVGVIPQPNPDDEPIFEKMYICLDACKKGFLAGCRPFIDLDGAFLKTQHGGQISSAIGQDAKKHIYVIAYAIVLLKILKTGGGSWNYFIKTWEIISKTSSVSYQIC
ncbi:hypothetical protein AHAS_Ahas12G0132400 [Arachis hypogaea]